ncbi:malto-oligosyltrehalose synthase [Mucilaginibacter corticis]|uniref:4-alpha-glucanotransferase n=1 Tax=Mucilaginibacter corticis TaxID=2597670 RepID=A0A556MMA0_9SPHI|nr:malto-oligosyltrehalose synthase [Mucilaginibacter corticis]TSJ41033.1 malto-oligosyltrehalose synthase [Mucilaginibacter corticis]
MTFNPAATYRIQFHKDFNFKDFEAVLPYLERLGISAIYASPIFRAVPGSMHGYDVTDPLEINPEIGTLTQLRAISKKLKALGIAWIQDIVPNHMAYHADNHWLTDVLEKGPLSAYKDYFDLFTGPVMAPFLGGELQEVIEKGELTIAREKGKFVFKYFDNTWPLNSRSAEKLDKKLQQVNRDKDLLTEIAGEQFYRLCSWKETDQKINYRRFFTVNGLICLNIQRPEVFPHYHQLIVELLDEGVFQGLRVDHIDGLYDPGLYLRNLRELAGDQAYIIVEKILEQGESMPNWPVQGNTGYDFLSLVNNLFTSQHYQSLFTRFYRDLAKTDKPIGRQILEKKALILNRSMSGELDNLTSLFFKYGQADEYKLRRTIAAFLVNCPVYKYYGTKEEHKAILAILKKISDESPDLAGTVKALKKVLLDSADPHFYHRLMQFTGPLMAKGVEDTLMYTYNRFIDHNEVGDSPAAFGTGVQDFHRQMISRLQNWPLSMNATATHDTKRGEDVRCRLNVLSDMGQEWLAQVVSWQELNKGLKTDAAPDANDEYFIYQTLAGSYPMPGEKEDDYRERLAAYLEKMLREGKQHSDWAAPDLDYEAATKKFAAGLLDRHVPFWKSFSRFLARAADFGVVNSLSQVVLKFLCPGVPDVYQGCEHWDLSLVDPDNRRPVDYAGHEKLLAGDKWNPDVLQALWENRFDGQLKVKLTGLLLQERKKNAEFFKNSDYLPLTVSGKYRENVIAFARKFKQQWYLVALPLHAAALCSAQDCTLAELDWGDTRLELPPGAPRTFSNLLLPLKPELNIQELFSVVPLAILKAEPPVNERGAGMLLPVFSLPAPFGIGDLGPGATAFADLLYRCGQKYWQLLPLSPVDAASLYSPYSANSSMAGNVLLISPELLHHDRLLSAEDLERSEITDRGRVDYARAGQIKEHLFELAWDNFRERAGHHLQTAFQDFCDKEAAWLGDYALYAQLKIHFRGKPWHQWPGGYRLRKPAALKRFTHQYEDAILKTKWLQFIFSRQFFALKAYCNEKDIRLFGDLPFYVSYDSADVWANPEFFSLDKNGKLMEVAGVPPDYFNANGQLWGMPVFRWDRLAATGFAWWLQRINKNLEYYDLLRLDHFRAFSNYWAVPAGEDTAINGQWKAAPGKKLFELLLKELGNLPFVAEDLGDIDQAVYRLRDDFNLPGMKVLQFAFGEDLPVSAHAPHNYTPDFIVYTGTHDNNTTKGWYRTEADETVQAHLKQYTGRSVSPITISRIFISLAYASVAKIAIIPLQDWLGLDETARMNIPADILDNWTWRLSPKQLLSIPEKQLEAEVLRYNRY